MTDFTWRNTWPLDDDRHSPDDFTGWADRTCIGRIYPVPTTTYGTIWKWFALFYAAVPNSGQCDSCREAMLAIEDGWLAMHQSGPPPSRV
jgi:hypothetical protein